MDWLEAYDILLWNLGIPVPDDDENRFFDNLTALLDLNRDLDNLRR